MEIVEKILGLIETMEEGNSYVAGKLEDLDIEGAITVLADIINAFSAVELGVNQIVEKLPSNSIGEKTDNLRSAFDMIVKEYENDGGKKASDIMKSSINPAFNEWRQELESTLREYSAS